MTIQDRQNDQMNQPTTPQDSAEQSRLLNASRRRFGKSSLAASGIILTLSSRPVLGAVTCQSPSGFLSGNVSPGHGPNAVCNGVSPGYWKNHAGWPILNRDTARFDSVFSCNYGSPYIGVTMLTLLDPQSFDRHNLGMHLVAAYLNAMDGRTPFLTVERILSIFSEWQSGAGFTPLAGAAPWNAEAIVNYLKATQA